MIRVKPNSKQSLSSVNETVASQIIKSPLPYIVNHTADIT